MTAAQLRTLRASLGMTQYQLGLLLYMGGDEPDRPIRRWESGVIVISGPAQKALEMIAKERGIKIR